MMTLVFSSIVGRSALLLSLVGFSGSCIQAAPKAERCEMVVANAQLYPATLHGNTTTRERLLGAGWARRDGGGPHHGQGEIWRRDTDLVATAEGDKVRLVYTVATESSESPDELLKWDKLCQVCGDVLACDGEVSTLRVRDGKLSDDPMTWLDTNALIPAGEGRLYVIRFGHEILLEFGDDPMKVDSGKVAVKLRKLQAGASVVAADLTFIAGKRHESETRRGISIELPDDIGELRYDQREDDHTTFMRGKGESKMFANVLFDFSKLLLHPHLGSQPKIPGK